MSDRDLKPGKGKGMKIVRKNILSPKTQSTPLLSQVRVQKSGGTQRPSLFLYTLYFIYMNLYVLGVSILRRRRRYIKAVRLFFSKIKGSFFAAVYRAGNAFRNLRINTLNRLKAPFLRIGSVYREQKPIIASKKEQKKIPVASYLQVFEAVYRLVSRVFTTILNYIAPVCALFVLIFLINGFISQTFGLEVVYEGKLIGYIKSESDFESATRDVKSRLIHGGTSYTTSVPNFDLVVLVNPNQSNQWLNLYNQLLQKVGFKLIQIESFTSTTDLANSMIMATGGEIKKAYGFYLGGRLYGAVLDKDVVLGELEEMKTRASSGKPNERIAFEKSISLDPGLFPLSSIVDEQSIVDLLSSYETVDQVYIVEDGDTPTGIADKQGIPYSVLKEINPGIEDSLLTGMTIRTAVARPFLSVKSTYTDVYLEDVHFETIETQNAIYAVGYRESTQEGVNGIREVTAEITMINGMETERVEIGSKELRTPVPAKVTVGVSPPRQPAVQTPTIGSNGTTTTPAVDMSPSKSVSATGFIWPVASGKISVGLGGYRGHTGVDIAGPAGTPIYASASGTVTIAKRTYYGYGIHVKINHGDGFETLYAHCSDIYVKVGDYVEQGQIIGARGRTGNATGNHLHFEVIKNKSIQNPLNYVSP